MQKKKKEKRKETKNFPIVNKAELSRRANQDLLEVAKKKRKPNDAI